VVKKPLLDYVVGTLSVVEDSGVQVVSIVHRAKVDTCG